MPKISVLQPHLLLKHHEKVRHFYTFHVSAFCTQCPPRSCFYLAVLWGDDSGCRGVSELGLVHQHHWPWVSMYLPVSFGRQSQHGGGQPQPRMVSDPRGWLWKADLQDLRLSQPERVNRGSLSIREAVALK